MGTGGMAPATGGSPPSGTGGMTPATGGSKAGTGGNTPAGGKSATGGATAAGGKSATGGATAAGGKSATGGSSAAAGGAVSCSGTMPSGGTQHCSTYQEGTAAGLAWQVWSNGSAGCITTYSTPAFSATWNNNGDFLARIGLQWNNTKTYDQYGTISAQFSYTKTGTAGGYSYIGLYGWSTNPCVEYYIIDDSFGTFPFNAYGMSQKGTATIDGEVYKLFAGTTTGTGGSRCGSVSSWSQFWSVRQKARQCGTMSITEHFNAWKAAGMTLGKMDEAQILVEVGGGSGSVNFSTANVTTTQ
jgi:endo-1,4-beta-xylanase